jgi:AcrR family transcriptional regulator
MRVSAEPTTLWQDFKRQSIIEAVIQLMCREGLPAVTMERVAQEVGIAKGTVYLHYRDKQALLDAVKDSALAPMIDRLDQVFDSAADPLRKLESYSLRYLSYFDERRDLFRILIYDREVTRASGQRFRGDRRRHLVQRTAQVIRDGVESGVFRDIDADKAAAMFVEANFAIMNQRLLGGSSTPVEDDAQLISGIFLRGITKRRTK